MTYQRPDLLWIVPAAIAVLVLGFLLHVRRRRTGRALDGRAPSRWLVGVNLFRVPVERYVLVAVGAGALALAGTGPRDPEPPALEPGRPIDAMVVVDISRSMAAEDASPNRLARSREFVHGLPESLPSDRVGLVSFAYQAYGLTPPTDDHDAVRFLLDALEPGLVPDHDQGSRPGEALNVAADLLEHRGRPGTRTGSSSW